MLCAPSVPPGTLDTTVSAAAAGGSTSGAAPSPSRGDTAAPLGTLLERSLGLRRRISPADWVASVTLPLDFSPVGSWQTDYPTWDLLFQDIPPHPSVQELCELIGAQRLIDGWRVQKGVEPPDILFMAEAWESKAFGKNKHQQLERGRLGGIRSARGPGIFSLSSLWKHAYVIGHNALPCLTTLGASCGVLLVRQRPPSRLELVRLRHGISPRAETRALSVICDPSSRYSYGGSAFLLSSDLFLQAVGLGISPITLSSLVRPHLEPGGVLSHLPCVTVSSVCSGISLGLTALEEFQGLFRITDFYERDHFLAAVHLEAWSEHAPTWHQEAAVLQTPEPAQEHLLILSPDCVWSTANAQFAGVFEHALAENAQIIRAHLMERQPNLVIYETVPGAAREERRTAAAYILTCLEAAGRGRYTWHGGLLDAALHLQGAGRRERLFFVGKLNAPERTHAARHLNQTPYSTPAPLPLPP